MNSPHSRNRRKFLRETATLTGVTALLGPKFLIRDAPPPCPVIDTHIHLYDPARPGGVPWPPKNNAVLYAPHLPKNFQQLTAKHNVVGGVVLEAMAEPADNEWVLNLAKDNPLIVGYIGRLFPAAPDFAAHFEKYAADPIFRGLRLSQKMLTEFDTKSFATNLQRLADRQLTVDVVGGSAMLPDVLRLARRWPELRVVIDHVPFKNWDGDLAELRKELAELAREPNVYAKISYVARRVDDRPVAAPEFYRPALDALTELFGPDRVLYGSNWPVSNLISPYENLFNIVADYFQTRGREAAEKFFWKNSRAAYRWIPRGAAKSLREG
ncbi:MAG: amidohydrolase family protein [Verrucomicrobia bacterium]|nr:amidohydrolase family protein [Verrucomicrobiota bacterium]